MNITKEEAIKLIASQKGKFFSACFIKKNGEVRKMVCRVGVKKYLKDVGMNYDALAYNLIPVYDVKKGYRVINLNHACQLIIAGNFYQVNV